MRPDSITLLFDGQNANLAYRIPSQYKDYLSRYGNLHCKDKTVPSRPLVLIMEIPILVTTTSLYWDCTLILIALPRLPQYPETHKSYSEGVGSEWLRWFDMRRLQVQQANSPAVIHSSLWYMSITANTDSLHAQPNAHSCIWSSLCKMVIW